MKPILQHALSLPFPSQEFSSAWSDWQSFRKEIKKPLTPTSIKMQLKMLGKWSEQEAIASIERSIVNGWQGLFEAPVAYSTTKTIHMPPPRGV